MASYYVYSAAAGAADGSDWANAYTTLAAATTSKAAGDVFYVADDHAETQASAMTITSPGTAASPCYIYCVNRGGSVPPVSADLRTTATITTTGANAMTLTLAFSYVYGITFSAGSGAVNSALAISSGSVCHIVYDSCVLKKAGTTASAAALSSGASGSQVAVVLRNTVLSFGAAGDSLTVSSGTLRWYATASALSGTTPTTGLFQITGGSVIDVDGVDLSSMGSGSNLIRAQTSASSVVIRNCKLGASVAVAAATAPSSNSPSASVQLVRCDSGDTNYRSEKYMTTGTLTTETTIVRTGGASNGTTTISWNVTTAASPEIITPFECFPISIWNETVGSSVTVTVECRGGAVPNNDEVWMDVEYLGTSGFPIASFATTTKDDLLASGSACTSSSETWGGSTSSFKLTKAVTPQEKGPITVYVKVAKASSTFYIDPKITLS